MTLKVVAARINEDPQEVISAAEDLLRRAKEGEIESFVAVIVRASDQSFMTKITGHKNKLVMAGALAFALHDFIDTNDE
jgi:hypothetical protein